MNKIIVSVLFALVLIFGINKITDVVFHVDKPEKSAYLIASTSVSESTSSTTSEAANTGPENILVLLASANISDGEKVFKKCTACHSIAKGGKNKIGPALWGILGRQAGSMNDYKYSKAMAGHGKKWSFEEMNNFLIKPKDWIKGTKMSFAGLKKPEERAAVILYMNQSSDSPLPLQ
jgi:cytochrome c|tara:strand:- start:806 stop:1336 length:531 start_codon:yes stop_codon:yes gene_type:complete